MKSARFYKIIISILVLLNVGVLGFFWLNKPPMHGPPTPIVEIISFNHDIKLKVADLEKEHHSNKRKLIAQSRELHQEFYSDLNRTEEEKLVYLQKIGSVQMDLDAMTFDFFQNVMSLCNEDQKIELTKIIRGAIDRFDGPKPPKN